MRMPDGMLIPQQRIFRGDILLVQVGTLSSSPIPRLVFVSFLYFFFVQVGTLSFSHPWLACPSLFLYLFYHYTFTRASFAL